ncbi:MAG: PTS sugar transporter subunit IIB [Gemmatimonadales bacterium]
MSLALVRVDDRLIHGQVVVGWANALNIDRILLIDDHVCANQWERDLYRMGVPAGMQVEFASAEGAAAILDEWIKARERSIVVVADIETLTRLCNSTDVVQKVNIGGVHDGDGRKRRLPYVFLSDDELETLRAMSARGIEVTAQDVPTARAVPLVEIE